MLELSTIKDELRRQGWDVLRIASGRWKGVPPNGRPIVHFSERTTNDTRTLKNTIAALKASGFVWPPPPKVRPEREPEREQPSTPPLTQIELLYRELREARGYLALADDEVAERGRKLDLAVRAFEEALDERARAAERLIWMEMTFDRAAGRQKATGT